MNAPTIPLSALQDAAEALRLVKDMPGDATAAQWMRAAHQCAYAYGRLCGVKKIADSVLVTVSDEPAQRPGDCMVGGMGLT